MRHSESTVSAGLKSQPPAYSFETTVYDQFQVIFVASGELHLIVRDQDICAAAGHLVALPAGGAFRLYTPPHTGYGGVFCVRRGALPAAWQGEAEAFPADRPAQQLAGQMQQEISQPGAGSQELLEHLGLALGWQAVRRLAAVRVQPRRGAEARYWADAVRQGIQANLYTARGVHEILDRCGRSYRQLARRFTALTGVTPKEYQLRLKMAEAQRLLAETDWSVTTIAFELGFPSSQHFATQFLRITGKTPSAVRRKSGTNRSSRLGGGA